MKRVLLVPILLMCATVGLYAQTYFDAETLHSWWLSYKRVEQGTFNANDANQQMEYIGYVAGVTDTLESLQYSYKIKSTIPANVKLAEILAIVGNYLDAHPEHWNYPAPAIVLEAIGKAFPPS